MLREQEVYPMVRRAVVRSYEAARKVTVAVVGGTVVLFGMALIVLPGPALVVIPLGLAILALEFAWARRWLHRTKERSDIALARLRDLGPAWTRGGGGSRGETA